jgi:hypothetical protein
VREWKRVENVWMWRRKEEGMKEEGRKEGRRKEGSQYSFF